MNADRLMTLLAEACVALEEAGDHAAAAHVGQAMDMIAQRHGSAQSVDESSCGQPN